MGGIGGFFEGLVSGVENFFSGDWDALDVNPLAVVGALLGGGVGGFAFFGLSALEGAVLGNAVYSFLGGGRSSLDRSSPTYAGFGPPTTTATQRVPIAFIYGKNRLAGNYIYFKEDASGQTAKAAIALGSGDLESCTELKINDIPIADLPGCSYSFYTGTGSQTIDSRIAYHAVDNPDGQRGNLHRIAYLALTLAVSDQLRGGFPQVTCIVEGRKIPTWNGSIWTGATYSNNPAAILRDFLLNGCLIDSASLDDDSFGTVYDYCDGMVDNDNGGTEHRYECDLVIDALTSASDVIKAILASFYGFLVPNSQGKIKLYCEAASSSAYDFTDDEIVADSVSYRSYTQGQRPNTFRAWWIDPSKNYERVQFEVSNRLDQETNGTIYSDLPLLAVHRQSQVSRMLRTAKLFSIYNKYIWSFDADFDAVNVEPGSIVTMQHDLTGETQRSMRVSKISEGSSGNRHIEARDHDASIFTDDPLDMQSWTGSNNPNPASAPPQCTNLTLTEMDSSGQSGAAKETGLKDGTYMPQVNVTFDVPGTDIYWHHADIERRDYDDSTYRVIGRSTDGTYYDSRELVPGATYYYRVVSVNESNVRADVTGAPTANITIAGKQVPPSDVSGFNVLWNETGCQLYWNDASDANNDLKDYVLKFATSDIGWAGATDLAIVETNQYAINLKTLTAARSLWFYIKARDRAGNYSTNPASTSVSKNAPNAAQPTLTNAPPMSIDVSITPIETSILIGYRVYASATPGFTPAAANLIGQASPATSSGGKVHYVFPWPTEETIYVKLIAYDQIGDGATSSQQSILVRLIEGDDIVVNTITSAHLLTAGIDVGGGGSKPIYLRVWNSVPALVAYIGQFVRNAVTYYGAWFKTLAIGGTSADNAPIFADENGGVTIGAATDDERLNRQWVNSSSEYLHTIDDAQTFKPVHTTLDNAHNYYFLTSPVDGMFDKLNFSILFRQTAATADKNFAIGLLNESSYSATIDGWLINAKNAGANWVVQVYKIENGTPTKIGGDHDTGTSAADTEWHRLRVVLDQNSSGGDAFLEVYFDEDREASPTVTEMGAIASAVRAGYPVYSLSGTNSDRVAEIRVQQQLIGGHIDRYMTDFSIINNTQIPENLIFNGRFISNLGDGESSNSATDHFGLIEGWIDQSSVSAGNVTVADEGAKPGDWHVELQADAGGAKYAQIIFKYLRDLLASEDYTIQLYLKSGDPGVNDPVARVRIYYYTEADVLISSEYMHPTSGNFQAGAYTWTEASATYASRVAYFTPPATTAYAALYISNYLPTPNSTLHVSRVQVVKGRYTSSSDMPIYTDGRRDPAWQPTGLYFDQQGLTVQSGYETTQIGSSGLTIDYDEGTGTGNLRHASRANYMMRARHTGAKWQMVSFEGIVPAALPVACDNFVDPDGAAFSTDDIVHFIDQGQASSIYFQVMTADGLFGVTNEGVQVEGLSTNLAQSVSAIKLDDITGFTRIGDYWYLATNPGGGVTPMLWKLHIGTRVLTQLVADLGGTPGGMSNDGTYLYLLRGELIEQRTVAGVVNNTWDTNSGLIIGIAYKSAIDFLISRTDTNKVYIVSRADPTTFTEAFDASTNATGAGCKYRGAMDLIGIDYNSDAGRIWVVDYASWLIYEYNSTTYAFTQMLTSPQVQPQELHIECNSGGDLKGIYTVCRETQNQGVFGYPLAT